jgi:hypothetical protein
MKKASSLSVILLLFGISLFAQKAPVRFGKLEITDLEMTSYALDTSAPAVVLCDYGVFDHTSFTFRRILRIKILKKEGLYYASQVMPSYENTTIRGVTYNLENGEIVETKLKNESVFKERLWEDNFRFRIAMPNVIVGSVFDIELSFQGLPLTWYFQRDIPIKWSELIINKSPYIDFRKYLTGYEPLTVNTDWRWVAENMPAFKEEAYTNSVENYLTKFEFDILSINFPGYYKEYTTSWEAVSLYLGNSDYFGKAIQGNLFLNAIAKSIEEKYTFEIDKLKAAYEAVKKVKWDETERLYTTTPNLSYAYNKLIGNSADINLMLVSLLKKLGINSYPVVMRTRANGMLNYFPSLFKLNYVIAYAKIRDQVYLLDATEEYLPSNLLPERALNSQGRLILGEAAVTIDLTPKARDTQKVIYNLNFTNDLNLKGTAEYSRTDYGALNFRNQYHEFSSEQEFLEDRENDYPGLAITDFILENLDSLDLPIRDKYEIEIKNAVTNIDDKVYLNPMLVHQLTENPFKIENRQYPVDYAYLQDYIISINYTLPEGYEVVELPKQAMLKLPENAASFMYNVTKMNNSIYVTYRFNINKITFLPLEYLNLKEFYNQIIKKHAEPIVLKKV